MNLIKVLNRVNQIEKISFLKILDKYSEENREKNPKIDKILSDSDNVLKKAEDTNIVKLFNLLRDEYTEHLKHGIKFSSFQLELIVEIFIRDGNQMMTRDWFNKLYRKSLNSLKSRTKIIKTQIKKEKSEISLERKRDFFSFETVSKQLIRTISKSIVTSSYHGKRKRYSKPYLKVLDCRMRKKRLLLIQ